MLSFKYLTHSIDSKIELLEVGKFGTSYSESFIVF